MATGKYNFDPREITVLIIDDQVQVRKAMRRVLHKIEFKEILETSNAADAIKTIDSGHPDLLICDLALGETHGFAVLENVRHRNLGADIPILVVTGESSRDDIVRAVDLGANDYLLKPFQPDELEKKVVKLLNSFASPEPLLHKIRTTEKLLLEQKYPAALLQLIEANGIDDQNIQVRFLHAFALSKTGQLDVAEKMLENILAEHPAYYRANALLAEFRLMKGRVGEAASLMAAELEVNGKQPERQVQLGRLLLDQGRAEEAIAHFRKALLMDQRMRPALIAMGHAQIKKGNIDKGLYYFKRMRRYYPDARDALEAIVSTCERIKDLRRAELLLRDVRAGHPEQTDATVILARVYFMQEKLEDAITLASELTKTGEADEANLISAIAEIKSGRPQAALAALEAIKKSQNMSYVFRLMAELHLQLNNATKAEALALRAFSTEPWSEQALLIQAQALAGMKEHGKARLALMRASMLGAPEDVVTQQIKDASVALKNRRLATTGRAPTRVAS